MRRFNFPSLILTVLICESVGVIGSFFTISSIPIWYAALNKPSFNPPNWIFGPVWTGLYFIMGVALYLIWLSGFKKNYKALLVFGIQLILNLLWSIVFFEIHSISGAMIVIVLLWILILFTIFQFWKISRPAAMLLAPYLVWVTFAALLNYYILILN